MIGKYYHKRIWKLVLFAFAIIIGVASVVYTNYVVQKLAKEERERIQTIVKATKLITEIESNDEALNFLIGIIKSNTTTPVIVTDTNGYITQFRNIDSVKALDSTFLYATLEEMKEENEPVFLNSEYFPEIYHYGDSSTIIMLKYYPYVQLFIIALFIFVSYLAFSSSRKFEQNQVWVGMSKETAHQLGTPLSSLMAWVEYFRGDSETFPKEIVDEVEKDVNRLEVITERFSKVGSQPVLSETNARAVIESSTAYLQKRVSKQVAILIDDKSDLEAVAFINVSLFEWVIENLCKNAVDAMVGKGSITFLIQNKGEQVIIDVKDTGRGIPIYLQKTVFNPGYTTRKRGWGLGLSLAKRIIESYHNGQIFVATSEPGKGTTFRIKLQKKM
ncbi:MAG: HAMP domain-containing histidine kinase [Bacteroidia bacterium]